MKFSTYAAENTTAKWLENLGEFTDERGRVYDLVVPKAPDGRSVAIFPHRGDTVFGEVYNIDLRDPYAIEVARLGLVASHHEDMDNVYELENGELSFVDTPE